MVEATAAAGGGAASGGAGGMVGGAGGDGDAVGVDSKQMVGVHFVWLRVAGPLLTWMHINMHAGWRRRGEHGGEQVIRSRRGFICCWCG